MASSYPEQIRSARLQAGLTLDRVARGIGLQGAYARSVISHYEHHRIPMSERQARRILDAIAQLSLAAPTEEAE